MKLIREGVAKWTIIAEHIPGRTAKQCRERWSNHLDPNVNKGEWTPEEDKTIIQGHRQYGNRWSVIAKVYFIYYFLQMLTGRTENAVKIRWKSLDRKEKKKKKLLMREMQLRDFKDKNIK